MDIDETDFIIKNGRRLYAFTCSFHSCGGKSYRRKDQLKTSYAKGSPTFCSTKCRFNSQMTSEEVACGNCGKGTTKTRSELRRRNFHYCSLSCASSSNNRKTKAGSQHHFWKGGHASYRERALRNLPNKCCEENCMLSRLLEFVPIAMLDADHIDGDRTNNILENLQLLCVWCHAMKTRKVLTVDFIEKIH